jgi:hypothetical protein
MKRIRSVSLLVVSVGMLNLHAAPSLAELETWLKRELIDTNQPMLDVQAYTESRVPLMPAVRSVAEWEKLADRMRKDTLDKVVFRGEAAAWRDAHTKVEWLDTIEGGPGYRIKKLRYEALPGLWIPALLYEPEKLSGKVPVILNVNGHDGNGKQAPYKQIRCINQARRGMLALNVEWVGMGQLRLPGFVHYKANQLDLCGTSGVAVHYLAMKRALDLLLALENADPARVAVTGLSGGGWQTIFISSLDTRVKFCNPVAGYSSFRTRAQNLSDLGDSEQTPTDLAIATDYAQMTAMMAPRACLLTYNSKDNCCFASGHALPPLLEAAQPIYRLYKKEELLRSHVNDDPGTHNYELDNRQAHYRMLGDVFFPGDQQFSAVEIPSEAGVKTKEQLEVPLPAENLDFHKIALALSEKLPRNAVIPQGAAFAGWQKETREKLYDLVAAKDYKIEAEQVEEAESGGVKTTLWRLRMGGEWTVPAVEFAPANARLTVILVADAGRKTVAAEAAKQLAARNRVLAMDPFYFGESRIAKRDFLFAMLVAAVGDRPLGLQASQLMAAGKWLHEARPTEPVNIVAIGPRASLYSLVASALETKWLSGAELVGSLDSLKDIIKNDWSVDKFPELFCFSLLEHFDLPQLKALASPSQIVTTPARP